MSDDKDYNVVMPKLKETESTKVSFRLQDNYLKSLKILASYNDLKLSETLRLAVFDLLEKHKLDGITPRATGHDSS